MKHHLRSDKNCLNCGAVVPERFCSHCGQENLEPKENVGHLINHFFNDITHYDSKFFLTIKYLFTRPGFLTKEYVAGRRMTYLNPVRMYIFISFIFFLTFFSILNLGNHKIAPLVQENQGDTLKIGNVGITGFGLSKGYKSLREYDSLQHTLPTEKKDGYFAALTMHRDLMMRERYGEKNSEMFLEHIIHNVPKMMFLLLPLFALFLKWMYDKKQFVYVDHAIFSIHFHAFIFLVYLIFAIIGLVTIFPFTIINVGLFFYLILAMRRAYGQTFLLSFFKGLVLYALYFSVVFIAVEALALFTFFFV